MINLVGYELFQDPDNFFNSLSDLLMLLNNSASVQFSEYDDSVKPHHFLADIHLLTIA
jgi:hypothetical protein